ncbi:MAG: AraC family transcriptional regulator ligand-binding domain-containing protein [Myxococcota bacterium]
MVKPPARVSGAWTRGQVQAFRRLGIDAEALCESIGVDIEVFLDASGRPPRDASGRLWRAALEQTGDRFLGLRAADAWEARVDHLVYLMMVSARTFGEGITTAVRFQELLAHGRVVVIDEETPHVALHINKVEHELPVLSHEIEYIAALFVKLFRFATDSECKIEEVRFEHAYRGNMDYYTQIFRAPVKFGMPRTTLVVSRDSWGLKLSNSNHVLHDQLAGIATSLHAELQDNSFHDSVRERIKALLPKGSCSIESVAAALHLTPRTLQRRLQEEGTTFRALMDATRKAIVLDCVERQQAPDEIVRHAGYTNPRSFRRAMKRWNL